MDLDGGVDVAGVYLIIVGHLAVAAAVLCSRVVTPAIVTLVVLPESTSSKFSLQKLQKPSLLIFWIAIIMLF